MRLDHNQGRAMWADTVLPRGIEIITEPAIRTLGLFSPKTILICVSTDRNSKTHCWPHVRRAGQPWAAGAQTRTQGQPMKTCLQVGSVAPSPPDPQQASSARPSAHSRFTRA